MNLAIYHVQEKKLIHNNRFRRDALCQQSYHEIPDGNFFLYINYQ